MVRVRTAKLTATPTVIPNDLALPPRDADKMIGRSGQIQGARMVTRPEMKAKMRRTGIRFYAEGIRLCFSFSGAFDMKKIFNLDFEMSGQLHGQQD